MEEGWTGSIGHGTEAFDTELIPAVDRVRPDVARDSHAPSSGRFRTDSNLKVS